MHFLTMIFLLSILILIHELGHFGAAKFFGLKVDRFGFGLPFGPTLFEKKIGETVVCIHAMLLGGYVSFPDDDPDSDLPADDYRRLSNRPVWQRFWVISAGVIANLILAFLIVLFVAIGSKSIPSGNYNIYVAGVKTEKGYSANTLGLKKDDKIQSANGVVINSPYKFIELAKRSKKFDGFANEAIAVKQKENILKLNPNLKNTDLIKAGTTVLLPSRLIEDELTLDKNYIPGSTNFKPSGSKLTLAQVQLRDKLDGKTEYNADGKTSLNDIILAISDNVHPINMVVVRGHKEVSIKTAYPNENGLIGINLKIEEAPIKVTNPKTMVTGSWDYLSRNAYYMVAGLGQIFTGQVKLTDLHGIVAITKIGTDVIKKQGMYDGLLLTALISLDLAIVNLLPIPALDGGHLLFLLIEKIKGKPVDEDIRENFAKVGFILLISLMVFVIFNDIFALIHNQL